jgi:hypothetical protein
MTTKQNTKGNQKMIVLRGIEFNDARLAKATCEVLDTLETLGFKPYKLTSVKLRKQQSQFGCCHTKYYTSTGEIAENKIYINRKMMDADDKSLRSIIAHEIGHSLKECCYCGHDGAWSKFATTVNKNTALKVKQYGSYEEYGIVKDSPKTFQCKCADCGHVFTHTGYRAPKWYVHTERFSHTHADGTRHKIVAI